MEPLGTKVNKTPHFYITTTVNRKDIPGRPVITSIDYHSSKVSKFLYHYPQQHANNLPSFDQDTTYFENFFIFLF